MISAARLSWVLREVFRDFSEEARTRGFSCPSFGGFGFVFVNTIEGVYYDSNGSPPTNDLLRTYKAIGDSELSDCLKTVNYEDREFQEGGEIVAGGKPPFPQIGSGPQPAL